MTMKQAERLQHAWKEKNGGKACWHGRIIESLEPRKRRNSRNSHSVVCRECGAIIADPYKQVASPAATNAA